MSWLQWLSAVILEPKKIKSDSVSTFSTSVCHEVMKRDAMTSSQLFHSPLLLSSRKLFSSSLHPAVRVVLSTYLRLLIFLPAILIPAGDSFTLAFCILDSSYKLNKQDGNIQPCHTLLPILSQSVFWYVSEKDDSMAQNNPLDLFLFYFKELLSKYKCKYRSLHKLKSQLMMLLYFILSA